MSFAKKKQLHLNSIHNFGFLEMQLCLYTIMNYIFCQVKNREIPLISPVLHKKLHSLQNARSARLDRFFLPQAADPFLQIEEGPLVHLIGAADQFFSSGKALKA